jgi:hypothetical protein
MKKIITGLLAGLVLGGAATWLALQHPAADKPGDKSPDLDITTGSGAIAKKLAAAGLAFAAPETALLAPEVKGYGRVLDASPLVASIGEIRVAQVTASASEKEFTRTKALHDTGENASLQAVETAEAAMLRDRAQLDAARARLITAWGRALAEKSDLSALVRSLALGEVALVRIDLLPGDAPAQPPATARVGPLTGDGALSEVEVLGPAPLADPQAQGAGYLALWHTGPLAPGTALQAVLAASGDPQKVLVLPRSAFVRHEGGVFIYVQTAEGGFERRLVTLGSALPAGMVVTEGVAEKDKVVVTGAQQLLATELLGSAGGGGDDN